MSRTTNKEWWMEVETFVKAITRYARHTLAARLNLLVCRVLLKCHHMCDTLQPLASTADTDKGLALKQRRVKETEQNVSENVELSYTPDLTSDI
ncbi:hypothetical protein V1477_014931 [Vespula maculifrons]|uniref:Uncharacterized protein n=1 Tax=Vespula maculifrons TaxID=7453 RepID=A0ABD2BJ73_VESMC